MRANRFQLFVYGTILSAFSFAAENWDLESPRAWSRDHGESLKVLSDGSVEFRHEGSLDWCLNGFPEIPVREGDSFTFSCETERLPGSEGAGPVGLSVITSDKQGRVTDWDYANLSVRPGQPVVNAFMAPADAASIRPRVMGSGPCSVRLKDVRVMRSRRVDLSRRPSADAAFETPFLKGCVLADGRGFSVTDRRTGRVWKPSALVPMHVFTVELRKESDGTVVQTFVDPLSCKTWKAAYAFESDRPELTVTIQGDGEMRRPLAYPAAFAAQRGDRLILPLNEGMSYPADEPEELPRRLVAYGGHGLCMSFFGVQDDATGAGWQGIFETPDDAALLVNRDAATGFWSLTPSWEDQKRQVGYRRRIRYVFHEKGGYVAMCKRYRAHAKAIGKLKTFAEKAKTRPAVDRLLGAVNVWCWEKDKLGIVREMEAAGIDRILWSAGASDAEARAMSDSPKMLVGRYDIYQDVYHPEQMRKLGWKKPALNGDAWPDDIVWNSSDSNDWRHAWGVKAKSGEWTHCAMMCDRLAPARARRRVKEELEHRPYNARFVDTTVAAPWQTCWNPAHPMTRSDSRHWKMELLRLLGDEFGLVVGSETGHDASVPYCDYFEGMLSIGPYRVPDSGRSMRLIVTNPPPRVVKFQVGESYRLPLWELVYHDCVCAHWYWGDYDNKIPSLWAKRDLFNVLYGTMGMFMFDRRQWTEGRDRFVRSFRLTSPVARATGYSEMLDHRILSKDRSVQQSLFADGTRVTVNFGTSPWTAPGGAALAGGQARIEHGL